MNMQETSKVKTMCVHVCTGTLTYTCMCRIQRLTWSGFLNHFSHPPSFLCFMHVCMCVGTCVCV